MMQSSGGNYNFRAYLTKDKGPPIKHKNFGDVCSKTTKHFNWKQTACPFYDVTGVGGVFAASTVHMKKDLGVMDSVQSTVFFHDGTNFRGVKLDYSEGFPVVRSLLFLMKDSHKRKLMPLFVCYGCAVCSFKY